jgi:hypothetical protein
MKRSHAAALLALLGLSTLSAEQPETAAVAHRPAAPAALTPSPPNLLSPSMLQSAARLGEPGREASPWHADQLMISLSPGVSLDEVAASLGATVASRVGPSGHGALSRPAGQSLADFQDALLSQPGVASVAPMGVIRAASTPEAVCAASLGDRSGSLQWHLDEIGTPASGSDDLSDIIVAVLDSGVAYEDTKTHAQAPSLASTPIVAPWDFVNDDAHPNDDHQHGTHIASLILSSGSVEGVAAGASLMPLKVLDADNSGTELGLINALYWAVDNGADIINMSLVFPEGYTPSGALRDALDYAAASNVVMIGASGNDGAEYVAWPAASPRVIAVGASRMAEDGGFEAADYSNLSTRIDLLAPGGDLTRDIDGNGLIDGMIAETINPADPTDIGLWMYAGTSQAAALVSGAAVWVLASGTPAQEVLPVLQSGAFVEDGSAGMFDQRQGAGQLDLDSSLTAACDSGVTWQGIDHYRAGLLVWMEKTDSMLAPKGRITLYDESGAPVVGGTGDETVTVYATIWGESGGMVSCTIDENGTCDIAGESIPKKDSVYWMLSVDSVVHQGLSYRPETMIFSSDALEILLAALQKQGLDDALLLWSWADEKDKSLGDIGEAYSAIDTGTGLSSSPLGIVFTPQVIKDAEKSDVTIDLDGTGLSSSPLGVIGGKLITMDGTGLSSSPLGLRSFDMLAIDGTGLSSSPLGLHSTDIYTGTGGGYDDPDLDNSGPIMMSGSSTDYSGTAIGTWLSGGGWVDSDAYPLASLLSGSGTIEISADAVSIYPTGDGCVRIEE